jgi:hypothetical protein
MAKPVPWLIRESRRAVARKLHILLYCKKDGEEEEKEDIRQARRCTYIEEKCITRGNLLWSNLASSLLR